MTNDKILLDYILTNSKRLLPKGILACVLKGSGLSKKQALKVVKQAQSQGFDCQVLTIEKDFIILEAA
jgi:hypothetical protein